MFRISSKTNSKSRLRSLSMQWYGLVFFIGLSAFFLIYQELRPQEGRALRQSLIEIVAPVASFLSSPLQNTSVLIENVRNGAKTYSDNRKLRHEVATLRAANAELANLRRENSALRSLLNAPAKAGEFYISARIISDTSGRFYRSLMVNVGTEDGARENMPAISQAGLVGRTIEVGKKYSRILLLSDWASRIPAIVENTNLHAVLAGRNSSPPQLIHIKNPSNSLAKESQKIKDGTRVLTSGRGGIFPAGIPIGTIKIDTNKNHPTENNNNKAYTENFTVIPYVQTDNLIFLRLQEPAKNQTIQTASPNHKFNTNETLR